MKISDEDTPVLERERLSSREQALRQALENSIHSKGEFLARLSHELRTPMTAMLCWMSYLRQSIVHTPEAAAILETIDRNIQTQALTIENLIDLARASSGGMKMDVRDFDLSAVAASATETARPAARARSVSIKEAPKNPIWMVSGDPRRIEQALWNLISNAVKFTPPGGEVEIGLRRDGRVLIVSVSDTGIGIAPEHLKDIFEPFNQVEDVLTRRYAGLGLGLSLARRIVELNGGTVKAWSEGLDKGSQFMLSIPLKIAIA